MATRPSAPKIDISLLQTFHLVAKLGSFSAAARDLNISYQSAANHVRRLEQVYGMPLLHSERGSRKVMLTPQGKALHASLGAELEIILSRIDILLDGARSVIRVGVPQALFHHFFPRILVEFRRTHPAIELAFFERDTTLAQLIVDGALDAAVSERHLEQDGIAQHLLGEYHLSLIYPRAWAADMSTPVTLDDFAERLMITYEPGQTIRTRALDYLGLQFGHAPLVSVSASGSTSVAQLVQAGLGYAVVPGWLVPDGDHAIGRIMLDAIKPMNVYFAHTALLMSNPFIRHLQVTCASVMGPEFSAAGASG